MAIKTGTIRDTGVAPRSWETIIGDGGTKAKVSVTKPMREGIGI